MIPATEKKIIALISAIQFVNVLDFMMVMPLGPDFARALNIPNSQLGMIGGSYTMAAAIAGILGSLFLDRFDRRKALFISLMGLVLGTLAGGFAWDLHSLMIARILAGCFGGPATSLSYSVIADTVPPSRRGRAMGAVLGSFSLASIFGVPGGLELARLGGWRFPFFAVAGLALLVSLLSIYWLPPLREHLKARAEDKRREDAHTGYHHPKLFTRPEVWLSYAGVGFSMLAAFMMIPNFSAFFQFNMGYPREHLGLLYFLGGGISFFMMRIAGRWIDRYNVWSTTLVVCTLASVIIVGGCALQPAWFPTIVTFCGFMICMSMRGVCVASISSRVPDPTERAKFMSFQSAIQHLAASGGAMVSTRFLSEGLNGRLEGMPHLAMLSASLTIVVPGLIYFLEIRVRRNEARRLDLSSALRA